MGYNPVNRRLLPTFLILACLIPLGGGIYRASEIIRQAQWRLVFAPEHVDNLPLFLHAIGAVGFLVLGAAQLWPGLRQRKTGLHRRIGKIAIVLGLLGAATGLWMTLLHGQISGPTLFWGRLLASMAWGLCIVLGFAAVRRRQFSSHRAWMIRAYALALPAGTLAYIMLPVFLIIGEEGNELFFELVQTVAWPIHLAVAEYIVRRGSVRPLAITKQTGAAA